MDTTGSTDLDALLRHTEAVRHLARRLVLDDDQADDVLQDACLAAIRRPPPDGVPLRAWITGIVRRVAAHRRRGDSRRRRREAAQPVRTQTAEPHEIAARAETHRALVRAVLALPDPYRTTLLLRFFDGLRVKEIAERLDRPPATVSTHVHRGIALLRARLDDEHDGRRLTWFLALLPVATRGGTRALLPAPQALSLGALLMTTKMLVAGITVLLLTVGLVLLIRDRQDDAPGHPSAVQAQTSAPVLKGNEASPGPGKAQGENGGDPSAAAALDPRRDLHGIVVDEAGRAIRGARVEVLGDPWARIHVYAPAAWAHDPGPREAAETAGDGSFRLRLLRDECADLQVRAAGFATVDRLACTAGERLRIVLPPAAQVAVTVVDERGSAVADAALKLWRKEPGRDGLAPRRGTTDAHGTFTFAELPPGAWAFLECSHAGYAPLRLRRVDFPPKGSASVTLELARGQTLRGRVLDAESGEPLAGARIGMGWMSFKTVPTDMEGHFVLHGWTSEGYVRLYARAEGHASEWLSPPFGESIEFRLRRGATVRGRVVSPEGAPVANAQVALVDANTPEASIETCDAQGRFVLQGARRASTPVLVLLARGFGRTRLEVDVPDSDAFDLGDVRIEAACGFAGRVLSADGSPAAYVAVEIEGGQSEREARCTDADGAFRFGGLAPGSYKVSAKPLGQRWIDATVTLEGANEPEPLVIRLHDERLLRVHVLDDVGQPVAYAYVAATTKDGYGITAMTDGRGWAEVRTTAPVASLEVSGSFTSGRYFPSPVRDLRSDEQEIEIVMQRARTLRGLVVDPAGHPVVQAVIEVFLGGEPFTQASNFSANQIWSNLEGQFTVLLPPERSVDLVALPLVRDGEVLGGRLEGLAADTPDPVLRLHALTYDRHVIVHALAPDGGPAADVQVYARVAGRDIPGANVRTDAQGLATLRGLPSEAVVLHARVLPGSPHATDWTDLSVYPLRAAGQTMEVRFEQAILVRGIVLDAAGRPATGAMVAIGTREQQTDSALTGEDGTFLFRLSPALTFPLRLMARLGERLTPAVEVSREHADPIELRLP